MRATLAVLVTVLATVPIMAQSPALSTVIVGGSSTYQVRAGDTVGGIAARFGTSEAMLIELNHLVRPYVIAAGQSLTVDNRHIAVFDPSVSVTINLGQRLLVHVEGDRLSAYPAGVGRRTWATPEGAFTIVDKERNPAWDVPVSIQREMAQRGDPVITRMEPSPDNPLGAHWLRLSFSGVGIHGTNNPASVYKFSTHGCIRLHPDDVAELYERLDVGTTGRAIYQPVVLAAIGDRVWVEVHRDEYRRVPDAMRYLRAAADRAALSAVIDWAAVGGAVRLRRGLAVDVTARR